MTPSGKGVDQSKSISATVRSVMLRNRIGSSRKLVLYTERIRSMSSLHQARMYKDRLPLGKLLCSKEFLE